MMNTDEIHYIVRNLFVGNKLERGDLELHEGHKLSLKNIESPILVFASLGDNIAPAQQALNWIPRVYDSVEDIKRHGQVIIYIVHKDIGHLGIFVAGSVAKKEHKQIIGHFDMIDFLPPGLYEMVIEGDVKNGNFSTQFEPRTFTDIAAYDDGEADEPDFSVVAKVSETNDNIYKLLMRPWVKFWTTELSAEIIRYLHPLRMQRFLFADINPLMRLIKNYAPVVRRNRKPASADNPFLAMEKDFGALTENMLNMYRDYRDFSQELFFRQTYGNYWLQLFIPPSETEPVVNIPEHERADYDKRLQAMEEGGHVAGLIRIYMAVANANKDIKRLHFELADKIAKTHKVLSKIRPSIFKKIMHEQTALLQANENKAIETLSLLIKDKNDRMDALSIARRLCQVDGTCDDTEKNMLDKIKKGLKL
jgi:hypothetical protein